MSANDQYVNQILHKYHVSTGFFSQAESIRTQLYPMINEWAGGMLLDFIISGSCAKGTNVQTSADIDLLISLSPNVTESLSEIYNKLFCRLGDKGLAPRKQNVSIGINYNGCQVDLVPAKKRSGNTNDHAVFKNKTGSWAQTNIQTHINNVKNSGRINEIKALKIWRDLHKIDFPSLYLELTAITALSGRRYGDLANNIASAFEYLAASFESARVVDPANTNNIISEDLSSAQKRIVADTAAKCLKKNWNEVLW
jgi:predicted nucleotidyltransferase